MNYDCLFFVLFSSTFVDFMSYSGKTKIFHTDVVFGYIFVFRICPEAYKRYFKAIVVRTKIDRGGQVTIYMYVYIFLINDARGN